MSLSTFQTNLTNFFQKTSESVNQPIQESSEFASFLADEYDSLIKAGLQSLSGVPVLSVNKQGLQQGIQSVLDSTVLSTANTPQPFIQNLGPAFITYWTGGLLQIPTPPVLPAPGAISNVQSVAITVDNPGTWTATPPTNPPTPVEIPFVVALVSTINNHLLTLTGTYYTISLYPAVPAPVPGPGVVPWFGYTVLP